MAKSKCALWVLLFLIVTHTEEHAQRTKAPRIRPIDASEWTDAHRDALGSLYQGDKTINPFKICARHTELCRNWLTFGRYVGANTLPRRDREMLILRTAWLCRDDYLWSEHARSAKQAGLADDE